MEEQHGFDANFIGEVPNFLKCAVCHLVMRQPVQIMSCGHRFCKPCFERLKEYSRHLNLELCCPIDREAIDIDKVFNDTAVARDIGNLQITCSATDRGCPWKGDLRNMQNHKNECRCCINEAGSSSLLKELCQRVTQCEDALMKKEKDIAYLKYNLHEIKSSFNNKEKEVVLLKVKNCQLEEEITVMKENNKELKSQLENLALKHLLIEKKVEYVAKDILTLKEEHNQYDEVVDIKHQINNIERTASNKGNKPDSDKAKAARKNPNVACDETNELIKLSNQVENFKKEMNNTFHDLNAKINGDKCIDLVKQCEKSILEVKKNFNDLEQNITNIENIMFCDYSTGSNEIVLNWKLQNFQYHYKIGRSVSSPIFLTQVHGYRFKMFISWDGNNKEKLSLYLRLCSGKKYDDQLNPFKMNYVLEMTNKDGTIISKKVSLNDIEMNRDKCFTLQPGKNQSQSGWGFVFLTMLDLKNFIINDMLSFRCRLTPS